MVEVIIWESGRVTLTYVSGSVIVRQCLSLKRIQCWLALLSPFAIITELILVEFSGSCLCTKFILLTALHLPNSHLQEQHMFDPPLRFENLASLL